MKRQKAIIKNSALPKVTKVVVESEPNLVAENIRKGVTILGVEGTYEDGASGGLTPFTVGQRINGITIDPTAKTDEEMIEWLNTFSIGAGTADYVVLLKGKQDGSVGDIVLAGLQGNIRTLAFVLTEDIHLWFMSEGIPEAGIQSKGWYIINEKGETATPITEKTTLNGNTYEVAEIADQFAFLNGIVLGAVEAGEEPLVPFRVGQTIKGVTIDPTAKTNEEIANWLNTLSYTPDEPIVLMDGRRVGHSNIVEVSDNNGVKALIFFADGDNFLCFSSEDIPDMNVSKGWFRIVESEGTPIPITEKTTFDSNYEITTIAEQFAFLNGTVLGAVEGEAPQETLTPFRAGQHITAIKIDTNAKTNEELSAFVAKLNTDGGAEFEKGVVSALSGNALVNIAEFTGVGKEIIIQNYLNNPVMWVSNAGNFDGPIFDNAGWYSVNGSDLSTTPLTGLVELPLTETVTIADNIDATFNSELNGVVFGVVEGEAPTTTLTNIEVGQRLKGIKFDTTKTPDLSQYTLGEMGIANLINSTDDHKDPQGFMFVVADLSRAEGNLGNGRAILVAETQIAYSEVEIADYGGQHIPQGWNTTYLDENGVGLFKESEVEPQQYVNVTEVIDGHLWNGIFAGAVLADSAPETPTTFVDGQTINGITVSPNVKTDTEMIEWLNGFSETTVLVGTPRAEVQIPLTGAKTFGIALSNNKQIMFVSEDTTIKGSPVTKGWHCLEGTETVSGQQSIQSHSTYLGDTYTVTGVTEAFAFLNGTVLGAVEVINVPDVPQETLTPFGSGQTISAIKVNTSAKTNEQLSTFVAKALEGQGNSKTLVSDSVGTPIIGIRGSVDSGYIITAESDNSNNIFWVSKDLNLDGKFTFPSAGWYLANEDTSSVEQVSGIVELSFTATVTTSGNNDIAFDELNGTVFGVVKA